MGKIILFPTHPDYCKIPLREIVIVFFICNEALSILENAAEFINIPQQLKDVLLQLRDKNAVKAEEKEESEE